MIVAGRAADLEQRGAAAFVALPRMSTHCRMPVPAVPARPGSVGPFCLIANGR